MQPPLQVASTVRRLRVCARARARACVCVCLCLYVRLFVCSYGYLCGCLFACGLPRPPAVAENRSVFCRVVFSVTHSPPKYPHSLRVRSEGRQDAYMCAPPSAPSLRLLLSLTSHHARRHAHPPLLASRLYLSFLQILEIQRSPLVCVCLFADRQALWSSPTCGARRRPCR